MFFWNSFAFFMIQWTLTVWSLVPLPFLNLVYLVYLGDFNSSTAKASGLCGSHKLEKSLRDRNTRPPYLPPKKPVCRSRSNSKNQTWNNRLVPNWERSYVKAVYCHPAYLTSMQSTSCEMRGWLNHKLESRLPREISIPSDMQMTPPLWQKVKN